MSKELTYRDRLRYLGSDFLRDEFTKNKTPTKPFRFGLEFLSANKLSKIFISNEIFVNHERLYSDGFGG